MTPFNETDVLDALRNVIEPDLGQDLVTLNMIQNITISPDGDLSFTVILTTPACPLKDLIRSACTNAIRHFIKPCKNINIDMTATVTSKSSPKSESSGFGLVKNTIAIASGKGGVGKSTVASNIAVALAKTGASVGLIDADIYGPSIPTLFNVSSKPVMEESTIIPIEKHGVKLMSIGFMIDPKSAIVWRGPMLSSAIKQFMDNVRWGPIDYMIFDLPPGTGDIPITLAQTLSLTGSIVVTTPQDVALADVVKAIAMFNSLRIPILGIIENMSYYLLPDNSKDFIFGQGGGEKLSKEYNIPFLGTIPLAKTIREHCDTGNPIATSTTAPEAGPFKHAAEQLARSIAIHNASASPITQIEI